ncbi:hypothetical protein CDL12_25854 [Handroanthus impetiginosus]|uniref:RING-type E3 ubiquitin transferase n=1 Tax=Handroanthus impetiginosus TaxID=429701 RepID=A0A2G9G8L8_9LAMI|nr:hypothetical protein CDL12_25854 [Handroanthus impetiginosus]
MMKTLFFTYVSLVIHLTVAQNDCLPTRCDPLSGRQPEHCGYPGFDLSCAEDGTLTLDLQFPLTSSTNNIVLPLQTTVTIETIDYKTQKMRARNAVGRSCLPEKVPTSNSSASPFEVEPLGYSDGYTLFNCSSATSYGNQVPCLSGNGYEVFAFSSVDEITSLPPYSSCFKMYNISFVPGTAFSGRDDEYGARFYFSWRKPSCGSCEEKGQFCRLKDGGDAEEIECFRPQESELGEGMFSGIARNLWKERFQ